MGVKNLYSLLKENQIFEDIRFRNSKLVVDGYNLIFQLYFRTYLDQNHGGEYLAFQAQVRTFFTNLDVCGVKPYVLMDGGPGDTVDRLETIMDRTRQKIQRAHEAAVTGKSKSYLPIHTWLVFEQTLSDMNVPQVKCFGEADCQVAALAREWCCPVLSKDSDFSIFDLPKGFLLFDTFRWDAVEADHGGSYIPCQRYTTTLFCNFFHINPNLLPVFASDFRVTRSRTTSSFFLVSLLRAWSWVTMVMSQPLTWAMRKGEG
ncbi:hypothetical protein CRUP_020484 [Coryphaenoides rupestris]|nr:hypothetical protein CRUP_020484 [Coryphaenoides rupestris]